MGVPANWVLPVLACLIHVPATACAEDCSSVFQLQMQLVVYMHCTFLVNL